MTLQEQMINELKEKEIFKQAKTYAFDYLDKIEEKDVYPSDKNLELLQILHEELKTESSNPKDILELLHKVGSHGTVTHTGGRYFGFIIGGAIPISLATKWLADIWDQCGGLYVSSPLNAELEMICER